jgi:hypothetical protein
MWLFSVTHDSVIKTNCCVNGQSTCHKATHSLSNHPFDVHWGTQVICLCQGASPKITTKIKMAGLQPVLQTSCNSGKLLLQPSHLSGVMVSVLAIRLKICGFKPGLGNGFLRAIKSRTAPSFGGEVKPEAPCRKILWHVKITCKYEQKYFTRLNSQSFHPFLLLATRCFCW